MLTCLWSLRAFTTNLISILVKCVRLPIDVPVYYSIDLPLKSGLHDDVILLPVVVVFFVVVIGAQCWYCYLSHDQTFFILMLL